MDLGLRERVAIVTGAGRGIGRQICLTLAEEGAHVAVNDLFAERAMTTAEEICKAGGQAIGIGADVTKPEQVEDMVRRILDQWGKVDILVNNAGIPANQDSEPDTGVPRGLFVDSNREEWDQRMHLITYGVLQCSLAVLKSMMEHRWGRIINIVSDAGRVGEPRLVPYSMAKSGVVGSTKALAKEVARHSITVNCVSPSATETDATRERMQVLGEQMMRQYPLARGLGRLGQPSDIASAVAFLASARAEWITGQILSVNGGYCMPD